MGFDREGFAPIGTGSGTVRLDMGGFPMEMPYDASFYLGAGGTVAAASAKDVDTGQTKWMFLSRTPARDVITISGRNPGAVEVEGVLLNTVASEDRDALLAAHQEAAPGARPDPALKDAIRDAPQRSADLTMKLMAQLMGGCCR
jgi:hypothetical protein